MRGYFAAKQIDLRGRGPARNMVDMNVQGLLASSGIPLPEPGGSAEAGGQGFRVMDLDHLQVPSYLHF